MKAFVIYASRHGNTQKVAEAVADGIRTHASVELMAIDKAPTSFVGQADLVVIGGPTEAHGMTPPVRQFFEGLQPGGLKGVAAAAFDTRLDWPRWMSGSAGAGIAHRMEKLGADLVVQQASFIVEGKDPVVKPGELERALAWGDTLARILRAELVAV